MSLALWVLQALLAFAFSAAGAMKLFKNKAALEADPKMGWAKDFSALQIRLIGLAEVLGGVGLILPRATQIVPILSAVAGFCLAAIMAGGFMTHLKRKEPAAPPLVLGV